MFSSILTRLRVPLALLLAVATLGTAVPATASEPAGEPPGAATPEALIDRMMAAAEAGDMAEMAACMVPEERAEMTAMMVAMAGMMVAFMDMGGAMAAELGEGLAEAFGEGDMTAEEQAEQDAEREAAEAEAAKEVAAVTQQYQEILSRHGLEDLMAAEEAGDDVDLDALLGDVDQVALLRDLMGFLEEIGDEEEGATAGGAEMPDEITDLQVDGSQATAKAGDETLELVEIDGRWYFKSPQPEPSEEDEIEDEVEDEIE